MPVDTDAVAETVEGVFGKVFLKGADPHGHIGTDGREHTAKQVGVELHHRKAICLIRTANIQKLFNLKFAQKRKNHFTVSFASCASTNFCDNIIAIAYTLVWFVLLW